LSILQKIIGFFKDINGQNPSGRDTRDNSFRKIEKINAARVEKNLKYRFKNFENLVTALKHRSYVYKNEHSGVNSNERMEFLGDAVLDLVVGEFIFNKYPNSREGQLTQLRSSLVNRNALAREAKAMKLGSYLLLSESEEKSGGRARLSILSDAYEAIIGAMYLDGGIKPVRKFLYSNLLQDITNDTFNFNEKPINYKSKLLEYTQAVRKGQPEYRLESALGPEHNKIFTINLYIDGQALSKGVGSSKKAAEQEAAQAAVHLVKSK